MKIVNDKHKEKTNKKATLLSKYAWKGKTSKRPTYTYHQTRMTFIVTVTVHLNERHSIMYIYNVVSTRNV